MLVGVANVASGDLGLLHVVGALVEALEGDDARLVSHKGADSILAVGVTVEGELRVLQCAVGLCGHLGHGHLLDDILVIGVHGDLDELIGLVLLAGLSEQLSADGEGVVVGAVDQGAIALGGAVGVGDRHGVVVGVDVELRLVGDGALVLNLDSQRSLIGLEECLSELNLVLVLAFIQREGVGRGQGYLNS